MKLLHLSDLHIGKSVNGFKMLDDQRFIIDKILDIIDNEKPDIILIAGDIYDKSLPSSDAVSLYNYFITQLAQRHKETGLLTYIISGNHDSPERIGYFDKLIKTNGIYTYGIFDKVAVKNTVEKKGETVNIYALPFIKPSYVRYQYPNIDITDYTSAVKTVLENSNINPKETNILIAHQYVSGSERSGSESASVGGLDNVEPYIFDDFAYVALGHIHKFQKTGKDKNIVYCGSPIKYSKTEAKYEKYICVAEINDGKLMQIKTIPIEPKHDMRTIRGTFEELTVNPIKNTYNDNFDDYIFVELTDENEQLDAFSTLQKVYPNIMGLEYKNKRTANQGNIDMNTEEIINKSNFELFAEFYEKQNGQCMNSKAEKIVTEIFENLGANQYETD